MAIMPPDSPLWQEVVAEEGLGAVWPMDNEDSARQLQKAWQAIADHAGEGGYQVSRAAGVVESSWPDPAGNAAVDAVTAYFDRVKETALQMAWVGVHALSYADHIEKAKHAVRETIAAWEESYAAAGVPGAGRDTAHDQGLVVYHAAQMCFKIIDDATRDIENTLARQAADALVGNDRGTLDGVRQGGNAGRLFNAISGTFDRWGVLTPITAVKTADDIENGKPVGQALVSNWSGWAANIGTGALLTGAIGGTFGGPVGMVGGMVVGAFTSGAVDSMYENGPTHLVTAMDRGAERVVDTFEGIGSAFQVGRVGTENGRDEGDEDRPAGQGN